MSIYYVGHDNSSYYLMHHGVKGQKWGVRRYQNADGTLTAEGRRKYGDVKTGFIARTKTRIKGGTVDYARARVKDFKQAKGAGEKFSSAFGYRGMAARYENRREMQMKLSLQSKTRLGRALHTQDAKNSEVRRNYAKEMHSKDFGSKVLENVVPVHALTQPYHRLSGRETTVGKVALDNMMTSGTLGLAMDLNYMGAKRAVKNAQKKKKS